MYAQTATKDNFADAILNSKVETFMKEDAGSSLYPRLMRKIKVCTILYALTH